MSDPVARLLQGTPTAPPEQDPVASLLGTATTITTPVRVKVEPPKKLSYEDLDNMFGDAAVQGMLELPRSLANLVGASKVRDYLDGVISKFEPELRGQMPNTEAGAVTAGHVIGTFATGIGQYKLALGGVKLIGKGIGKVAPKWTAKALDRISRAGAATELVIPNLGGSQLLAKQAGQAVRQLPPQLAAGLGQQLIADPEGFASAKGIGLSILFGFTGALGAGVSLARKPLETTKPVTVPEDVAPTSNTQPVAQVPKGVRDYGSSDILRATPEQIRTLAKQASKEERQVLVTAFGKQGARVYRRATKAARSSTVSPEIAAKSLDAIERMKSRLPEDQAKLVEEVESRGYTAARLRNVADEVDGYTPEMLDKIDSEILIRQFGEVLLEKNPDRNVSGMYRLVKLYEELTKRGVQADELFTSGVKYLEAKGVGADAAPMIVKRIVSTKKALEKLAGDTPPAVTQIVTPSAALGGENPIPAMLGEQRTAVPPSPLDSPLSPHTQKILDRIEVGYEKKQSKWWQSEEGLYAALARKTALFERVERQIQKETGKTLGAIDKPSAATQLLAGWAGKAERMLKFGPFRYVNDQVVETGAPGFAQILGSVRNNLTKFRTLAVARRTIEVNAVGPKIETGIDLADAIQEVRNADPAVMKAVEQTTQYLDGVMRYAEDRQLIDPVSAESFRFVGRAFIPLDRVFSGKLPKSIQAQYSVLSTPDLFKSLVGSKLKIVDPVYSVVDYTRRMVRAAELNEVGLTIVRLSEQFPEQTKGWVEKVADAAADNSPEIVVDAKILVETAKQFGTELSTNEAKELAAVLSDRNLLVQGDVMRVRKEGRVQQYRVDPAIGNVLRSLSPADLNLWVRMLGLPSQVLKVGITQNPVFGAFQAFVGMFQTKIQSRYGFRMFVDPWIGLAHRLKQSKEYQEALAAGGPSAFLSRVAQSTEAAMRDITPKGKGEKTLEGLTHPLEVLRKLSEPMEEMNRLGEYIRARRKGAKLFDAALAMRESDTDFSMIGTQMAGASHIVAFLNPFIQGINKVGRTAFEKPVGALTAGVLGVTAPSVYFWISARGDQEVRDLQRSAQGQRNWITRVGGEILKIPKPYVYGAVFGNTAEAVLDQMETENPEQYARLAQGLIDQTTFLLMPNALQMWTGLRNNTDLLNNGQPIVSESLARLDPELQYNDNTTDLAKVVGEHLGISPVKFDFATRMLLGALGSESSKAISAVIPAGESSPPSSVAADLPLIGRFIARYPSQSVEPIRTFYGNATKASQKLASLQRFAQQQKMDKVQSYLDEHANEVGVASIYAQTRVELSNSRQMLEELRDMPDTVMSPDRKRELADEIVRSMIETARTVNNAVRETKKGR